jgi:hypothetical protein
MPCAIAHAGAAALGSLHPPCRGPGGQVHGPRPRPKSLATCARASLPRAARRRHCAAAPGSSTAAAAVWAHCARTVHHCSPITGARGSARTGPGRWIGQGCTYDDKAGKSTPGRKHSRDEQYRRQNTPRDPMLTPKTDSLRAWHLQLWVVLEDRSRSLNRFLSGHLLSEPQSQMLSSSNRQTRPLSHIYKCSQIHGTHADEIWSKDLKPKRSIGSK